MSFRSPFGDFERGSLFAFLHRGSLMVSGNMYTFFIYFISIKFKAKDVSGQAATSAEASNVLAPSPLGLPYTLDAAGAPPAKPPRITLHHPAPPGNTLHHLAPLIAPVRSAFRPATLKFQLLRQNDKWTCSRKFLLCLLSRPTRPASSLCCHFLHSSNQKPLRRQPTKCVGVAETAAWADMCVL